MPMGLCTCGAVYACDETGHNLGVAMIEALVFGCNMDWDLAWGLDPEEDYQREIVENYDLESHLIIPHGTYGGRRIGGALYFIRLHQEVREVTAEGVEKSLQKAAALKAPSVPKPDKKERLSKKTVEALVHAYDFGPLLQAAGSDKKIIRYVQRLLYSGDTLSRYKAAEALGEVCAVVSEQDPGMVSKLLQGLFYSLFDTAAFPTGSFEAIGEIISHKPEMFGGFIPQIYPFVADETKKALAFQTLARISRSCPGLFQKHALHFMPFFADSSPEVRGYTAQIMGNFRAAAAQKELEQLVDETHALEFYENGMLKHKGVGRIAVEALDKL